VVVVLAVGAAAGGGAEIGIHLARKATTAAKVKTVAPTSILTITTTSTTAPTNLAGGYLATWTSEEPSGCGTPPCDVTSGADFLQIYTVK